MKLHLSTGGERCVNPFENLNSFMPLALPSWTYPRLKFSSILPEGEEKSAGGEFKEIWRFELNSLLTSPWYANANSRVRAWQLSRLRRMLASCVPGSFNRAPGHYVIYSLVLRMPGSPILSLSACFDNYGIDFCARRIFTLADARVFISYQRGEIIWRAKTQICKALYDFRNN